MSQGVEHNDGEQLLRRAIENIANQMCSAVNGRFDFRVQTDLHDETVEKLQMLINLVLDTGRRNLEALEQRNTEIAEAMARTRQIVEYAADGIITIDERGTIQTINAAAQQMFGYSTDELIGCNVNVLMPAPFCVEHDGYLRDYLTTGVRKIIEMRREVQGKRKDGSVFPMDLHISEVRSKSGRFFTGIVSDVTDRKSAEAESRFAREAAEAATRAKSEFLANMSHEIRTPMTAILGYADMLRTEGDISAAPPHRIEAIDTIRRNGEHLLAIINDILDLSKIEAGKLELQRVAFSPIEVIAGVQSLMRVRADAKGLELSVEYVGGMPEMIQSDPTRLRQILINLVGNAIKFTETGRIRLVVRLVQPEAGEPSLLFEVIDSGMGMDSEQAEILFQPFTQLDTSATRKYGGTGLGLAICKRLATSLGGDIEVECMRGGGCKFKLSIATGSLVGVGMIEQPGAATSVKSAGGAKNAMLGSSDPLNCRILLAEDGPDNQRLISFMLKRAGAAEVAVAENGRVAVDKVAAAEEQSAPYDVILMDMQMPILDGYQATSELRRRGFSGPIIAVTAHAMAGDREKCIAAGCDDYVTKPIAPAKLIGTVRLHTQGCASSPI